MTQTMQLHLMPKVRKVTLYRNSAKAVATILELYLLNDLQHVAYLAQKKTSPLITLSSNSFCEVMVQFKDKGN
jgi:hypothetical protein